MAQTVPAAKPSLPAWDWRELMDPRVLVHTALQVGATILLAWLAYSLLVLVLRRIERSLSDHDPSTVSIQEQRTRTLVSLVRSVGLAFIALIALFMVLKALGLDIAPLLASAGVLGLAISFGAQSLVKDIISGLFILFENQFGVGDVVKIGGVSGTVERMTLRIAVLRDGQGAVHIIPNGQIAQVSNLTRSFSRAVLDVSVAYSEDADRVIEVLREVGRELCADERWSPLILEEVQVPGIESVGDTSFALRVVATTVPLKQWDVARELRRRIKRRFDAEGIAVPSHTQTLVLAEGATRPESGAGERAEPATEEPR